jgi:hypothetical protein
MGFYDTGKRKSIGIRLTGYQQDKLNNICMAFGISHQRLFTDLLDSLYADYINVVTGTASITQTTKDSAEKLLDNYVDLDKLKGLVPKTNPLRRDNQSTFHRGLGEE